MLKYMRQAFFLFSKQPQPDRIGDVMEDKTENAGGGECRREIYHRNPQGNLVVPEEAMSAKVGRIDRPLS
jgi:hypothetical protein